MLIIVGNYFLNYWKFVYDIAGVTSSYTRS